MKPLVSFLCPAYNKEEYMSQMIMMFLDQTYKNTELIIVDDASTDGTQELCEYYVKKHKNIKYYRNKINLGVADSRNIARSHAKGDILLVQDADDQSVNGRAEMTVEFFKRNKDIDLMYGSTVLIDDLGVERGTLKAEQFVVSRLKIKNYVSHPTLAYRKSMPILYRKGLRYIDDWYFLLDCYIEGYKFGHLTNILSAWRVTKGGLSYDMGYEQGEKKEAKEAIKKEFASIEDDISDILRKSPEQRIRLKEILKRIPKGSTILDVGCNGGYTLELYKKNGIVEGVEIAKNLIDICRKKGFLIHNTLDIYSNYEIIILGDILEHYGQSEANELIKNAYNLATDRLIITVPYPDGRYCKKFTPEHKADYVLSDIQSWLPNAKMTAVPIYYGDDAIPLWSLIEVFK
jgi:glycosyltransferase involved in cell wall biosynthesis